MRGARRSGSAQRRDGEASGPSSRWKWTPFLIIINYRPFNKDSQQEASFLISCQLLLHCLTKMIHNLQALLSRDTIPNHELVWSVTFMVTCSCILRIKVLPISSAII